MAEKSGGRRVIPYIVGLVAVGSVSGGIYMLMDLFEKPVRTKKQVQQISIIQPPPPPPPEEEPPPPEVEEEVEIPEPEEIPEELPELADEPPAGDLGLDAEGGAGSDGFGLAGRKGGRGLLGGGADPATRFASLLKRKIEDVLSEYEDVRSKKYKVIVTFRVSNAGRLSPSMKSSTGDPVLDSTIKQALQRVASVADQAPADVIGKTIRFRIGV